MVRLMFAGLMGLLLAAAPATRPATRPAKQTIDASALLAEQQYPQQDAVRRWRPMKFADHKGTLLIENLKIENALNQRAMDIVLTSMDRPTPSPGQPLTFGKVIVRNVEVANIKRDETGRLVHLHVNHIRITGGGNDQPFEAELLLEDVHLHGGDALPLLIQEGKFSRITLRRVKIDSESGGAQIAAITSGLVGDVVIEDSPGLNVTLIGRNGSIKRCIVRNSPGSVVNDAGTAIGKTGAEIIDGDDVEVAASDTTVGTVAKPAVKLPLPKLLVKTDATGKKIELALDGELGEDVSHVTFEAFDRIDYRVGGRPVVVTEKPWKATIPATKRGVITVRAVITRLSGDVEEPISSQIEIR